MKKNISELLQLDFDKMILSNNKINKKFTKTTIRKISIKNQLMYQIERFVDNRAYHTNMQKHLIIGFFNDTVICDNEILNNCNDFNQFKDINIFTADSVYQCKNINGEYNVIIKNNDSQKQCDICHNRQKNYIVNQGEVVAPLVLFGVMDTNGQVYKKHMDKFVQINNFLKIFENAISKLDKNNTIKIADLCCGNSYLSYYIAYYLYKNNYNFEIIGVDLKQQVIDNCNDIKDKLQYDNLKFVCSDINDIDLNGIDVVISLHACDIATDLAIIKGVQAKAKIILAVPCCHKQVAKNLKMYNILDNVLKYNIFKERFCAMLTDSLRANVLEDFGYRADVFEFVDFDNSPKNIMIKAELINDKANPTKMNNNINKLITDFDIDPYILNLYK